MCCLEPHSMNLVHHSFTRTSTFLFLFFVFFSFFFFSLLKWHVTLLHTVEFPPSGHCSLRPSTPLASVTQLGGLSKPGPPRINKSKPTSIISPYMTFDIGLGEQHTLNCLRQRGTRKASWDGLGKYTEFFPAIGTISSNTSKCESVLSNERHPLSCWPL